MNNELGFDFHAQLEENELDFDFHATKPREILRNIIKRVEEGNSHNELGFDFHAQGEFQKAEQSHLNARRIFRSIDNLHVLRNFFNNINELSKVIRSGEANSLEGLGDTYLSLNQSERAIDSYQQAAGIRRDILDFLGEAKNLLSLAATYEALGQHQKAIEYYQECYSRLLMNRQQANSCIIMASCQNQIGFIRYKIGQNSRAIENHREALQISQHTNIFPEQTEALLTEQARALRGLGDIYERLGSYQQAIEYYEQAREISHEINDLTEKALALLGLGSAHIDNSKAIRNLEEALVIFQKIRHHDGEANAANRLGNLYLRMQEYPQATQFYERVLQISNEIGTHKLQAAPLHNLGVIAFRGERYEEAISSLQQSLSINGGSAPVEEARTRHVLGDAYNACGQEYYEQGEYKYAIKLLRQALKFFRSIDCQFRIPNEQIGDQFAEGRTRRNLGDAYSAWGQQYYEQGEYKYAIKLLRRALKFFSSIDPQYLTSEDQKARATAEECFRRAHDTLGQIYHQKGQYQAAIDWFKQMLETMRDLGNRTGEANALLGLGNVYHSKGNYGNPDLVSPQNSNNPTNASEAYRQALEIFQCIDSLDGKLGEANVLVGLGKTYHSLGQCQRAIEFLGKEDIQDGRRIIDF